MDDFMEFPKPVCVVCQEPIGKDEEFDDICDRCVMLGAPEREFHDVTDEGEALYVG